MKYNNILGAIGNTPVIRLAKLFPSHQVWIKLEKSNPGGSIKDRIALAMIEQAEKQGLINKEYWSRSCSCSSCKRLQAHSGNA